MYWGNGYATYVHDDGFLAHYLLEVNTGLHTFYLASKAD
jgi:hypothetical protein